MPNVGAIELAEALARVLPFTATDDARPVLACVNLEAKDGKLTLVGADGFRLAVISLDYADGEGQALITRNELIGVVNALRKAKRVRITFEEGGGEKLTSKSLIIDTELIRYKWTSLDGNYPDWLKLIPTEFNIFAHFDTVEAINHW
jgi:DNA polymerase III sliding clamp (beta) subunit (PCNA family)